MDTRKEIAHLEKVLKETKDPSVKAALDARLNHLRSELKRSGERSSLTADSVEVKDVSISGGNGIYTVTLHTLAARKWADGKIYGDLGVLCVVFPVEGTARMEDIARGMLQDGLTVEYDGEALFLGKGGAVCVRE